MKNKKVLSLVSCSAPVGGCSSQLYGSTDAFHHAGRYEG